MTTAFRLTVSTILVCLGLSSLSPAQALTNQAIQCQPTSGSTYSQQDNAVAHLNEGEFLLTIRKTDKQPAYICTESLQIHCQQARLLVINNGSICRVAVLDGKVTIKNNLDHSIVRVNAGIVYESTKLAVAADKQPCLYDEIRNTATMLPLFLTRTSQICLYAISLRLGPVTKISTNLLAGSVACQPQSINWARSVSIVTTPTRSPYSIGEQALDAISLPASITLNYPPAGLIQRQSLQVQTELLAAGSADH